MKLELGDSRNFITEVILFFVNLPLFVAYIDLILLVIKTQKPFRESVIIIIISTAIFKIPYVTTALLYNKYENKVREFLDKIFKFIGSRYVLGFILTAIDLYLIFWIILIKLKLMDTFRSWINLIAILGYIVYVSVATFDITSNNRRPTSTDA